MTREIGAYILCEFGVCYESRSGLIHLLHLLSLAVEQTSGRQRMNIHGAIDLETGQTRMPEVGTVDAHSTLKLLTSIEAMYPTMARIHLFLDNAAISSCKACSGLDASSRSTRRVAFYPGLLPAFKSN